MTLSIGRIAKLATLLGVAASLAGCSNDLLDHTFQRMMKQPKFKEYQANEFYADGRAMRTPPEGTLARENFYEDVAYQTGRVSRAPGAGFTLKIPVKVDEKMLARGKERYEITCTNCHGVLGDGNSMVARNMALNPPPTLPLGQAPQHSGRVLLRGDHRGLRRDAEPRLAALGSGSLGSDRLRAGAPALAERDFGRGPRGRADPAREGDAVMAVTVEKFTGGARWMSLSALVGIIGLVATAIGFAVDTRQALFSYLVAFVFWCGIAVSTLIMVAIFHAAGAKWMTLLRRAMESVTATIPVFAVLFIPLLAFLAMGKLDQLFVWLNHAPPGFSEEQLHHLHHKSSYLNATFFVVRAAFYFAVWIVVSQVLRNRSIAQDTDGKLEHSVAMRRWGPGSLPLLGLTITFAGFDWIMSLEPLWFSTIFGGYYFAGSFVAAFAVLTILTVYGVGKKDSFANFITLQHFHNLGKLLLAFTAFWAYIAFSQFLLIWIANIPEETPFYITRIFGGWKGTAVFLIVGQFLIPFVALLSRTAKLKVGLLARDLVLDPVRAVRRHLLAGDAGAPPGRRARQLARLRRLPRDRWHRDRVRLLARPRLLHAPGERPVPGLLEGLPPAMSSNDPHVHSHGPSVIKNPEDEALPVGALGMVAIISAVVFAVAIFWASRLQLSVENEVRDQTGIAKPSEVLGQPEIGMVDQQLFTVERRSLEGRRAEHEKLSSYGWVNRQAGTVHVPIETAMKKYLESQAAQPAPEQQQQPAPTQPSQPEPKKK